MAKKNKPVGYMVLYNDNGGLVFPYGQDPDCAGAITGDDDAPILFGTRAAARRAVTISERYARLCVAQGTPANEDFTTGRKSIRIVPVYAPA